MAKTEDKIGNLIVLIFVIFVIFYLVFALTPLIYLIATAIIVITILSVGGYLLYKYKKQILPFMIVRLFWDLIKKEMSSKSSGMGGKTSPLPQHEKNRVDKKRKALNTRCLEIGKPVFLGFLRF